MSHRLSHNIFASIMQSNDSYIPSVLVDAHHHFYDSSKEGPCRDFNSFRASLTPDGTTTSYFPPDYERDVIQPLKEIGVSITSSVHIEALPDDGLAEVLWVDSMKDKHTAKSYVASCDLTDSIDQVKSKLSTMKKECPKINGIRWILDVGPDNDQEFIPSTATHVGTKRHSHKAKEYGTIDYLKVPAFERGYACLAAYSYSFDLQCAPNQLRQAAKLAEKYPNIPVCIDHMAKPRNIFQVTKHGAGDDVQGTPAFDDKPQLDVWKTGMKEIAKLPHVYCKLSMLGYGIPGWHKSEQGQTLMKELLHYTIVECFGPERCMIALNWHVNRSLSDSDGQCAEGPSPVEFVRLVSKLLPSTLSDKERDDIFAYNACRFYKVPIE